MILIGVDPHTSPHTAVAVDAAGHQVAQRRFVVNAGTFRQLMRWCEQWPERRYRPSLSSTIQNCDRAFRSATPGDCRECREETADDPYAPFPILSG
ncbi:hypothetical protein [Streptomyces sp. NPDC087538]|uniref:hypothetical protein n=1 Tax=Streptomyces sp. NPDC087538 TaxID=3365797 RepID=UPI0037FE855C